MRSLLLVVLALLACADSALEPSSPPSLAKGGNGKKAPPAPVVAIGTTLLADSVQFRVSWTPACDIAGCAQSYELTVSKLPSNEIFSGSASSPFSLRTARPESGTSAIFRFTLVAIRRGLPSDPATTDVVVEGATAPAPLPPPDTVRSGYYVAPNGLATNAGTLANPWSLASVLSGSKALTLHDTVWVRGGTYAGGFVSNIIGTPARPIIIRALPGERATINGYVILQGSYTTLWGLEIMNPNPTASGRLGLTMVSPGSRAINMVVHDGGRGGVGMWNEGPDALLYGSIIYNNGTLDNQDHGVYFNGNTGTKYVQDNIVFNNWAYNLHAYSPVTGELRNLQIAGNVVFNGGTISPANRSIDPMSAGVRSPGPSCGTISAGGRTTGRSRFGFRRVAATS
jgi:hypothetical protein